MLEEYGRLLQEAELQQQTKSRKQRPKKFRCPHCQVAFSNNGQLKGHVRIHTGKCLQLIYRYTVSVSAADIQVHSLVCLQLIYSYTV